MENRTRYADTGTLPRWFQMDLVQELPLLYRAYAWWLEYGIKRKNGLSLGGNRLFSLIRTYSKQFPNKPENYVVLPWWDGSFTVTLDLLDFETFNHTIPLLSGNSSEARLLKMLLRPGAVFFDVGANYGIYSLFAAHIGGPDTTIHTFEPQPRLAQAIEISCDNNDFKQVLVQKVALGKTHGRAKFFLPKTSSGVASLYSEHVRASDTLSGEIEVDMDTLDNYFSRQNLDGLDLMKIDVEGGELDVMKGGADVLQKFQPFIWFEMSPVAQQSSNNTQSEIYQFLEEQGYKDFYRVNEITSGIKQPVGITDKLINVLAVPGSKVKQLNQLLDEMTFNQ